MSTLSRTSSELSRRPVIGMLVVALILMTGCTQYNAETHYGESALSAINEAIAKNRRFVILTEERAYFAQDLRVEEQALTFTAANIPYQARALAVPGHYTREDPEGGRRYSPSATGVRVHLDPEASVALGETTVPFSDIAQLDVFSIDTGATITSYTLATIGVVAATAVILTAIVALTKDSCPFVYTYDGERYVLAAEAFGGAISPSLERSDYIPLRNIEEVDGRYFVRVVNQLQEHEFLNVAELVSVAHPEGTDVLIDRHGDVHTVAEPQPPRKAVTVGELDYRRQLSSRDDLKFAFTEGDGDRSHITLTFPKPTAATEGKLIVHAKASSWLEHVFDQYTEQFGVLYDRWADRIASKPRKELEKWNLEQALPLIVYLETPGGWKYMDHFDMVGPLTGMREMVMPIDLSEASGTGVTIKIESGFAFWELDAVSMDFSPEHDVSVEILSPEGAVTFDDEDVKGLISKDDEEYLEQPNVGDGVTLSYQVPEIDGERSLFLHARGYYEPLRSYSGMPDVEHLLSFREEGRFTAFAKKKYLEYMSAFDADSRPVAENMR